MHSYVFSLRKLAAIVLLLMIGAVGTLAQTSAQSSVAVPQITQPIDESRLVPLNNGVNPIATAVADQGAAPDSLQLGRTILMLKSSEQRRAALKKYLDDQHNPKSPTYHKWLTPDQFGSQFGANPEDIQKVTQWLQGYGFKVEAPVAGRNLIIFSGTQAQLKAAFRTELHSYKVDGKSYWANARNPQIPAALAPVVSGFARLNNFPMKALHSKFSAIRREGSSWKLVRSDVRPSFTTTTQGQPIYGIGPSDFAAIYNVQPLWDAGIDGTGQTIAVVSDSDINRADVDYFRSAFGLPPTKLNIIYYGPNPGVNDHEGEADLDVQWAGAVAKNATIDLVVAGNSATSGGIEGAAIYIINNNLAPLLSVSYGLCEIALGTSGNEFINMMWQQAAAQGITVLVSTGDAGSAVCDQGSYYATNGLTVNGLASTPYNVAVGGTDFYATFVSPDQYWNSTNDPTTLQSAKSYIPETAWNDSCASPQVFATLQSLGVADPTPEAACNNPNVQYNFLTTWGGSGGASNCATVNDNGFSQVCAGGHAKPAWQSGVPGIPSDGVRDLPDVSLMSGDGLWGAFYVMCESDATSSGTCDVNNEMQGGGGTSFATPAFAGMLALVQQKTGSRLGNINYVLYKMAAAQYGDESAPSCATADVAAGNACQFYDVTEGTIAVPCASGTKDCTPNDPANSIGILPGFAAGIGYDLATGIGSVNAYNLVEGWESTSGTFVPTTTVLSANGTTSVPYGANLPLNVSVTTDNGGTPSGDVGIFTDSTLENNKSVGMATLENGTASGEASLLLGGTYQLFARYSGDATFAPSVSSGLTVTITPAPVPEATVTTTRTTVLPGQRFTVALTIPGPEYGVEPTGTATFTDTTSSSVLGTVSVVPNQTLQTIPKSTASITVSANQLQTGANDITVSYSGDSNYAAATFTTPSVTLVPAFTVAANPASVTMAPTASGTATIAVTPNGNTTLNPANLTFGCPANLPAGLACSFSAPTAGSDGTVTSTLTLQVTSSSSPNHTPSNSHPRKGWLGSGALLGLGCLGALRLRRRRIPLFLGMLLLSCLAFIVGCGGGGHSTPQPPPPTLISTVTSLSASSSAPAWNSPVTLTATVAPSSGTGTPTGIVTFTAGSTSIGTANLASGTATVTTSTLPLGAQAIQATYGGDSAYAGSNSSTTTVDVTLSTSVAVTVSDTAGNSSSVPLQVTVH